MTSKSPPHTTAAFVGAAGNRLVADVFGDADRIALLLHGGGQTRHAWRRTAERLAQDGTRAYALDQRGHGESQWISEGAYAFADFAADVRKVAQALNTQSDQLPIVIGASLGGIAALLADGEREPGSPALFSAVVLVDITPRVDPQGVDKIQGFMRRHAREGFTSVAEAAEVVSNYLPHRARPRSVEGLKKNLRLGSDGRWRWHWDPRFLDGPRPVGTDRQELEGRLMQAARRIAIPTLLVRGQSSELVKDTHAREFLDLVPHAEYVDVRGARHMVVGDSNDRFSAAILDFLARLDHRRNPPRIPGGAGDLAEG